MALWSSHNIVHVRDCDSPYETVMKVGRGTFGDVYKGRRENSQNIVAIKTISDPKKNDEKECHILRSLKHKNIVRFIDGYITEGPLSGINLHVVMEFCKHDILNLLRTKKLEIKEAEVKMFCLQLLNGLNYMHNNSVMHRDIKPSNLLMSTKGVFKIADFGLATTFVKKNRTDVLEQCGALRYKSPEMFLGDQYYGPGVDIWSYGVICIHFFTRLSTAKIFNYSTDEQTQMKRITELFGRIDTESYPTATQLPFFNLVESLGRTCSRRIKQYLKELGVQDNGVEFVDSIMVLNPDKRPDAQTLLDHSYFKSNPEPACLQKLEKRLSIIKAQERKSMSNTEARILEFRANVNTFRRK